MGYSKEYDYDYRKSWDSKFREPATNQHALFKKLEIGHSIVIGGIYNKKTNQFKKQFSIPVKKALSSLPDQDGDLSLSIVQELKKEDGSIQEEPLSNIKVSTDAQMEIFYNNKSSSINTFQKSKTKPLSSSSTSSTLHTGISYKNKTKKIDLEQVPILITIPLYKDHFQYGLKNKKDIKFVIRNLKTGKRIYTGSVNWKMTVENYLKLDNKDQ